MHSDRNHNFALTQTVLPLTKINQMKYNIQGDHQVEEKNKELQRLQAHKAKSQERISRWPNSINAYKTKKDQHRFDKFALEEQQRREIDLDEAEHQKGVKKAVLEYANKKIYETNDRVRAFQSKMLFSDVLQERESQLEMEKYKKELLKQQDLIYNEIVEDQLAEYDKKQLEKQKKQQLKKLEQKHMIDKQHDQMKEKYISKMKEDRIEGELVKQKVRDAIEEDNKIARQRRLKQEKNQEEVSKLNQDLINYKQEALRKEKEQDEVIRLYAEKKHKVAEMRKLREDLKFQEKQRQRQKMIDTQVAKLELIQDAQEQVLNKNIKEAEIKAEEVERIKKEKREQMFKVIEYSRQIKEQIKERESKSVEYHKKEFQGYWDQRNKELEEIDREESRQQKQRRKDLANFHQQQIQQKYQLKEKECIQELDELEHKNRQYEQSDDIFVKWASVKIKQHQEEGKNILPLIKELKHLSKQQ